MDVNQSPERESMSDGIPSWAAEAFIQFRAKYDKKQCKSLAVANWKEALRLLWYRASDDREPNGGILRSIRNHPDGYQWLELYPLKATHEDNERTSAEPIERGTTTGLAGPVDDATVDQVSGKLTEAQRTANGSEKLSDELQVRIAFGIGALGRGALEDLAADFGVDFDKRMSLDDLRADVLEKFSSQGYPHRKFEYDDAYWGGEYAGCGHVVYVPESLIAALGDEDIAYSKFSHRDPIHIVKVDSETSYRASGESFIGLDVFNEAEREVVRTAGKLPETTVSCSVKSRHPGDRVGCSSTNVSPADEEGFDECQDCALFFRAAAHKADDWKLPENAVNSPRIERISGGHNRVLVLHTQDADMTFVIPPGVSEHEWLTQESSQARSQAARLYERARQLTGRATYANVAAGLCNARAAESE
ncbi:hypothetical protein [Burkholderia cepacia]|uniref:hypothetical protein n=1 Tax=Burkholderia cepacia TaxID=292 RepID=UPI002AB7DE4C|nr:hypothetical protein [Burkholderia cepacia]